MVDSCCLKDSTDSDTVTVSLACSALGGVAHCSPSQDPNALTLFQMDFVRWEGSKRGGERITRALKCRTLGVNAAFNSKR